MELSPRLSMIEALIDGTARCFGDVGTDHAHLPISCIQHGRCQTAIASDINPGPLARAEQNIRGYGLTDRIELRLCSGLSGYKAGECDWISICGMGGCGGFCHTNKEYALIESVSTRAKILTMFLLEDDA